MQYTPFPQRSRLLRQQLGNHSLSQEQTPYNATLFVSSTHTCVGLYNPTVGNVSNDLLSFWGMDENQVMTSMLTRWLVPITLAGVVGAVGQAANVQLPDYGQLISLGYAVGVATMGLHRAKGKFKKPYFDERYVAVGFPLTADQFKTLQQDFAYLRANIPDYNPLGWRPLLRQLPIPFLERGGGHNCLSISKQLLDGVGIDIDERLSRGLERYSFVPLTLREKIKGQIELVHNGWQPKKPQFYFWFDAKGTKLAVPGAALLTAD